MLLCSKKKKTNHGTRSLAIKVNEVGTAKRSSGRGRE